MGTFQLKIVTPDGLKFDGEITKIIVRTSVGDVGILSSHADYVTPLATGVAKVAFDGGETKIAACSGGLLSVKQGRARIAASTFEWGSEIDVERARNAKERAEQKIKESEGYGERAAEIKLKKALTRIHAAGGR